MTTSMQHIVIVGATSAIAEATARCWARPGAHLYLIARNTEKLQVVAADLAVRGANCTQAALDVNDPGAIGPAIDAAFAALGRVDVVLIAHGVLPEQALCEQDAAAALSSIQINALSIVALLTHSANRLQPQGSGVIAVIGSVAGDRGRKSNYVYGSAKALVHTFVEGLAGRLDRFGVRVVEIKPGFVDTPMTANFKKGALWAQPDTIARIIDSRVGADRSGSFYAPGFWWLIMIVVKSIPARILYRLNI